MESLVISECAAGDADAIVRLLRAEELPFEDLGEDLGEDQWRRFLVARARDAVVGAVAVERHGEHGLLRSLVVDPACRGLGLGRLLTVAAEDHARAAGIRRLFLLTTTAAGFFPGLGWEPAQRHAVPAAIAATAEFRALCPDSAVCFAKTLQQ